LIAERTKQITVEVELAFEKKKTAALRWTIEHDCLANWDLRIQQLTALAEAHGNLAEQMSAKQSEFESQGKLIERWLEWHHADVELQLAKGCN
jgi:outer membrane protease